MGVSLVEEALPSQTLQVCISFADRSRNQQDVSCPHEAQRQTLLCYSLKNLYIRLPCCGECKLEKLCRLAYVLRLKKAGVLRADLLRGGGHYVTGNRNSMNRRTLVEVNHNKAITKKLVSAVHYQQVCILPPAAMHHLLY